MTSGTKNTSTEYREVGDTGNTDRRAGLESRPRAIPRGDDFPVLSRTLVDSLTSMPDDDPSLTRLANDVMREYTLTVPLGVLFAGRVRRPSGGRFDVAPLQLGSVSVP